jgi:hypothetical protein
MAHHNAEFSKDMGAEVSEESADVQALVAHDAWDYDEARKMLGNGDVVVALLEDEAVSGEGKHGVCREHVEEGGVKLGEDGGQGIIVGAGCDANDGEREVGRTDEGEREMGLGRWVCGEAEMEVAGLESILGHKAGCGRVVLCEQQQGRRDRRLSYIARPGSRADRRGEWCRSCGCRRHRRRSRPGRWCRRGRRGF